MRRRRVETGVGPDGCLIFTREAWTGKGPPRPRHCRHVASANLGICLCMLTSFDPTCVR